MELTKKIVDTLLKWKKSHPQGIKEILKPIDPANRPVVACGSALADNAGCPSDVPCGGLG